MIQLRTSDKKIIQLPDNVIFVELVNSDNEIACVICENKDDLTYTIFDSSDKDRSKRYSDFFGVKFINKQIEIIQNKLKDYDKKNK